MVYAVFQAGSLIKPPRQVAVPQRDLISVKNLK